MRPTTARGVWFLCGADLAPEEIISLMSCLVFQEKDAVPPVLTERLANVRACSAIYEPSGTTDLKLVPSLTRCFIVPCAVRLWAQARDKLVAVTLRVGGLQKTCGLPIDPQEYLRAQIKVGMMQVVYEWALGTVRHLANLLCWSISCCVAAHLKLRCSGTYSHSTKSAKSPMCRKVPSSGASRDWMRHAGI